MNNDLARLNLDHPMLTPSGLRDAVEQLLLSDRARFDRLWAYYQNPLRIQLSQDSTSARPYRQGQEWGLPARVTGSIAGANIFDARELPGVARKEVVIENDIGWRIDTAVDFLFGRPVILNSNAPAEARRDTIEALLRAILARNGGLAFLQQLALLGAVYGSVDVLVKLTPDDADGATCSRQDLGQPATLDNTVLNPADDSAIPGPSDIDRLARRVRFEIVEPARSLSILNERDCTRLAAFATVYQVPRSTQPIDPAAKNWLARWFQKEPPIDRERATVVEMVTKTHWQKYEDSRLLAEGENALGRLPLVHVQNTPDPLSYTGIGDVEPLLPLQDELNTRLSDRAHRIAMTSFRMYLGRGIENFTDLPISPGQMWSTDNLEASVVEFGGDGGSPSEDAHIADVREAMDKLSGVSPIAAGAIKGKVGRLTSAAALRVTMMALLSRTERRRIIYGAAIAQLCELALAWLDKASLFPTTESERGIDIHWSNPIPVNESERLEEARLKQALGVPT
ncbi:MAG TPA: phage portal protein, partial [Tepidisphaeraceae bacterium]